MEAKKNLGTQSTKDTTEPTRQRETYRSMAISHIVDLQEQQRSKWEEHQGQIAAITLYISTIITHR